MNIYQIIETGSGDFINNVKDQELDKIIEACIENNRLNFLKQLKEKNLLKFDPKYIYLSKEKKKILNFFIKDINLNNIEYKDQSIIFYLINEFDLIKNNIKDFEIKNKNGITLLSTLFYNIIRTSLKLEHLKLFDLNNLNKDNSNSLKYLIKNKEEDVLVFLKILIKNGINLNQVDNFGYSPISYAILEKKDKILDLLKENGAIANTEVDKQLLTNYEYMKKIEKMRNNLPELLKMVEDLNSENIEDFKKEILSI